MREIKFRAWDTKEKRYTDAEIFISNHSKIYRIFWQELEPADDSEIIVELSTGLKDKNGKEIYEGDILSEDYRKNIVEYSTTDVWSCNCCNEPFSGAGFIVTDGDDPEDWEVIGNIHENPELLEQKG